MSTLGSVAANARKPRIQLLDIMLPRLSMDSLNALISELVLCTKDKNAITRALSYTVLTKIAARYVSSGEEGAILPFMQTLLQGTVIYHCLIYFSAGWQFPIGKIGVFGRNSVGRAGKFFRQNRGIGKIGKSEITLFFLGLAGNPLTVSCTLNVLNISLHEFRREIPSEIHEMVLDNVLLLMGSNAREILKE